MEPDYLITRFWGLILQSVTLFEVIEPKPSTYYPKTRSCFSIVGAVTRIYSVL
jgi:hypothetical protein